MDPHSRHSQFNQRSPSAGPSSLRSRFTEPLSRHLVGKSSKSSTKQSKPTQDYSMRPIATNSRVKQDEKYRKDMYLSFVNNALQQKASGVSTAFDELVDQFNPNSIRENCTPQGTQIRLWIAALCHVVSRLERTHSALVEAIVSFPWTTMDATTVKSYIHFVGMLLSARPEYLSLVLGMITQGFTHQSGLLALNSSVSEGSSSPLTRRIIYDRLHVLLRHIYSLIPTLPSTLQPLLVHNFPHKRQNQVAQTTYIRNILRVTQTCPELADSVLATIIEHAIQIDVEIQVEIEELEEDGTEQHEEVFEIDPFDAVLGQENDSDSNSEESDEGGDLSDLSSDAEDDDDVDVPTNLQHIREMVKKLDAILKLVFDHLNCNQTDAQLISYASQPDPPTFLMDSVEISSPATSTVESRRAAQFALLLSIFERIVLCTFKSRYTQFLIFWYTSLDSEFSDVFQGMLVSKALLEQAQPIFKRAAAASYIASFVSRAQFVDRDGTRRVMGVLCDFLRNHLDVFDMQSQSDTSLLNVEHHSVFYAVSQAVFLIFCFRWRDFLENGEEDVDELSGDLKPSKKWMSELNVVQRLITCPLNPLKVCSENVVVQFARVAQATSFIYCYSILETNKRLEHYTNQADGTVSRQAVNPMIIGSSINTELNTFFPFDPYKLPKSNSYIQGIYREWSSVAVDGDEDEDDEDEYSENGEEADHSKTSRGGHLDIPRSNTLSDSRALVESMDAMSISPLRPANLVLTSSVA